MIRLFKNLIGISLVVGIACIVEVKTIFSTGVPFHEIKTVLLRQNDEKKEANKSTDFESKSIHNLVSNILGLNSSNRQNSFSNCIGKCHVIWFNVEGAGYRAGDNDVLGSLLRQKLRDEDISHKYFPAYASGANTIASEKEYLCGYYVSYYKSTKCIPNVLANKGWNSYYYHANDLYFYKRKGIMPKIGFMKLISAKESTVNPIEFLQICIRRRFCAPADSTIVRELIGNILLEPDANSFHFFMTIDTHGPHPRAIGEKSSSYPISYLASLDKATDLIMNSISELFEDNLGLNIKVLVTADHPSIIANSLSSQKLTSLLHIYNKPSK